MHPPAPSSPSAADRLPATGRYFVAAVIVAGALVEAHSAWTVLAAGWNPLTLVLLALTLLSGAATLRGPGVAITFSISDVFCISAGLLVGPAAGAIAAGMDGLVMSMRMKRNRRTAERVLFNVGAPALGTWLAAELFFTLAHGHALVPGFLGALRLLAMMTLFGVVNFGVNTGLVAAAVAMQRGSHVWQVWRAHFLDLWLTYFGGVFAAMLMMILGQIGRMEVLVLVAPLALIIYAALSHAVGRATDHIENLGKINKVYIAAIEALAHAIDTKDQVTSDHTRRVQENSVRLARRLEVTDDMDIQAIMAAALLHDVGKIGVPEHILNKPGPLTAPEFEIMKRHAPMGAEILSVIGFPYPVVPIVRHHHENWDGTGYPDQIVGDAIPIGARILSVVDCFDALTSDRPYRPRMEDADALAILHKRRGNMYDPRVVDEFFRMYSEHALVRESEAVVAAQVPTAAARPAMATADIDESASTLETFYRLGAEVAATMRAQDVGRIVWAHLAPHLPAATFVLFVYDEARDALVPQFRVDDRVVDADTQIALGERLSGWVAANGRTIMNSDARLDQDEGVREQQPLRSALAVPVMGEGRVVAVLSFYAEETEAFGPVHRDIAEAAARVLTIVPAESEALTADAAA